MISPEWLARVGARGPGWREVSAAIVGVVCGLGIGLLYGVLLNELMRWTLQLSAVPDEVVAVVAVGLAYLPWVGVVAAELQLERGLPGPRYATLRTLAVAPAYAFALGAPSAALSLDLLGPTPPSWYRAIASNLWLPAIALTVGISVWVRRRP